MLLPRLKYDRISSYALNSLQKKMVGQIESKLASKEYDYEDVVCIICGNNQYILIGEKERYGLYCPIVICKNCGLVYTNPRMNQQSYFRFYQDEYGMLYTGAEHPTSDFFKMQYLHGSWIFKFLKKYNLLKQKASVLEVGCGAGGILHYFKERGHSALGIDIGEAYIEFGKKYGLNLLKASLQDLQLSYKPDLIIYSHVLEHLLNPAQELDAIRDLMRDDSLLYIEVPGLKYLYKSCEMDILKYHQNAHVYHFTLTSLHNLLQKQGYKMIIGDEFVRSVFKKTDKPKNFLPKTDRIQIERYLSKMEKWRKFYPVTPFGIRNYLEERLEKFLRKGKYSTSLPGL